MFMVGTSLLKKCFLLIFWKNREGNCLLLISILLFLFLDTNLETHNSIPQIYICKKESTSSDKQSKSYVYLNSTNHYTTIDKLLLDVTKLSETQKDYFISNFFLD